MNFKASFLKIKKFLERYENIHAQELINYYPNDLPKELLELTNGLTTNSLEELASIESIQFSHLSLEKPLMDFLVEIKDLLDLPKLNVEKVTLNKRLLRKLKPKKIHEVSILKSYFSTFNNPLHFVDIGSGAGHLSNALVWENSGTSLCLDMDESLQEIGKNKINFWLSDNKDKITFKKLYVTQSSVEKLNLKNKILISLHGCGALSVELIKGFVNSNGKQLLNFGCCYYKLNDEINISNFAKEYGTKLTKENLYLAERTVSSVSISDLKERVMVKKYRYALHMYLYDNFKLGYTSVGNASSKDYKNDFFQYLLKYQPKKLISEMDKEKVDLFFSSEYFFQKFSEHFVADSIRALFGRVIELYLLLDRAIYLQEHGCRVEMMEFFDSEISPRNIGLFATK